MAESGRTSRIRRPIVPWTFQQIHHNTNYLASSATHHFNELHDYVVQGLSPLINTNSTRPTGTMQNQSAFHGDSIPESTDGSHQRMRPLREMLSMPNAYVIDMGSPSTTPNHPEPSNEFILDTSVLNAETLNNNNNNNNNQTNDADPTYVPNPELQAMYAFGERYLPFAFILFLKTVFDHRIGILVNLGLFVTFLHANAVVKREIGNQGKRQLRSLLLVFVNLTLSILAIYVILAEHTLANALIFIPPYTSPITIWEVLWIVSVTDFVLRLTTILVKVVFVALPGRVIAFQKKGKYFLFVERSSQLYRSLTPMQHWLYFFSESYSGPSKVFGVILSAAYLIFKCKNILHRAKQWKIAFAKMVQSKTYGVTPTNAEIKEAGDSCPICQDDFKSPSMLQCKHIFCEECVALWFDRERTCPICRAQIADDPKWRDGSTTLVHQIF